MPELHDDLALLICRHLDGLTTAEESARLADALRRSAEARAMLIELTLTARRLAEPLRERVQGSGFGVQGKAVSPSPMASLRAVGVLAAAAAMIALAITAWFSFFPEPRPLTPEPSPHAVAMLADSGSARWADHSSVAALTPTGAALSPGRLALVSGVSDVLFESGVMVTLTGPCEFELIDANRGHLLSGRLHAYVPPAARGFAVMTPGGVRVVDLGTAFDLQVDPAGQTTLHVTEGAVLIERADRTTGRVVESLRLTAGHGAMALVSRAGDRLAPMTDIAVVNPSFEFNNTGAAIGPDVKFVGMNDLAGWTSLPPRGDHYLALSQTRRSDAVDGIADNFPAGGADGDRIAQVNGYPASGAASLVQDLDASFEPGASYRLVVAVGRRLDHDRLDLPGAAWAISVHQADTGAIAGGGEAQLEGQTHPGEGGRLVDQTLRFTPSADDLGRRMQIRLTHRGTAGAFDAVNFDRIRLQREPDGAAAVHER